jgi:PAS domain S-box-containing protein
MSNWPYSSGEMAERIRRHDWAATPLGPIEAWSQGQKTVIDMVLASDQAMQLALGPERIILYNDAYVPMLGNRHPNALGMSFSKALPDIWAVAGPVAERVFAGETVRLEDSRWHLACSPIRNESGTVVGLLNVTVDATVRGRAERAEIERDESAELLREFGEASQDVLWVRDVDTLQWQYLSPAFEPIYGLSRDEVLSGDNYRNWQDMILPEDRARAVESIDRVARGEKVIFEYRIRRPVDGEVRWVRDNDFPMRSRDGTVQCIGGVGHDITKMKEVEDALAAAEHSQRFLLESIPQLLWRSLDGGHWVWVSPQWIEQTGLTDEASRGHGWLDALHPDDREGALVAWHHAKGNGLYEASFRVRHVGSGQYHWFQTRATFIHRDKGSAGEWLGTSTDIDEQVRAREFLTRAGEELEQRVAARTCELQQALDTLHQETMKHEQAEERLRQSEKLKAVGQLTGGIAHDFNNMLQGINSALSLVRTRLAQGRVSDATAYIEPAVKAASRAGALTHRLLAFSRQQTLTPEPVNIDRIVQGMEDMVRRTVGPGVQVELKLSDGRWLVLCDPNQLESALLNLCVNARDAMPEGGWLTISTEERVLSADDVAAFEDLRPGRFAVLAVTDTGTGMPPEVMARVFEPFFTTKPLGHGTGLGLSQIYGFMRQSGGMVHIETAVGKGTTVRLCLPFYEMNSEDQFTLRDNGKTLLLVEDEYVVRGMLADQLRDLGYRVLEADTAAVAMRVLSTGANVDLLVTDVGLRGGTNGRQLADAAREKSPTLPVIFITGFVGAEMLSREDVVRKPFETSALVHLIEERLSAASDA